MSDNPVIVIPPSTPSVVVVPASTTSVTPSTVNVSGTSVGPQGLAGEPGIISSATAPAPGSTVYWADTNEPGYEAVPYGGLTGQVLKKNTDADYDYSWSTVGQGTVTSITATSPLTGGTITGTGTLGIQDASTSQKGAVQLTDSVNSTATTTAATPNSVKTAYDLATNAVNAASTAQSTANAKASKGENSDITSITGLTTPLGVLQGGTGATNGPDALFFLGAAPLIGATFTGTVSAPTVSGTTASFTATGTFNQVIATNINATNFYATNFGTPGTPATSVNASTVNATTVNVTTVNATNAKVTSAPTLGTDVTNKTYVDGKVVAYTGTNGVNITGTSVSATSVSTARVTVAGGIDLATVTQTNSTGNTASAIVQGVAVDSYGRVTGVTSGTHTLAATNATGIVQLTDATNSTSITTAATPNAVKSAYDLASTANSAAGSAQSTANTAISNAATAQATANTALSNASTAQTTADSKAAKGANTDITSLGGLTTALSVGQGGTGLGYLEGGVLYGNGSVTLGVTNTPSSTTRVLISNPSTYVPIYGAIDLADNAGMVTGLLNVSNGGTNASSAANALTNLNAASLVASNAFTVGGHTITSDAIGVKPLTLKGFAAQNADLIQYQSSTSTVLGGSNANAQIFTGSTAPIYSTVGTAARATATSSGTTATITTKDGTDTAVAHNLSSGDLVLLSAFSVAGYNSTTPYVISTTGASTFTVTTSGSNLGAGTGGTVTAPAQASVTARSAGTKGLVVKAATSQAVNIQEWQDSNGTVKSAIALDGGIATAYIANAAGTGAIQIGTTRNVQFGNSQSFGGGALVIGINNATTVPTTNAVGGGILYVTGGALTYRGTSGSAKTIVDASGLLDITSVTGTLGFNNGGTNASSASLAINKLESSVGITTATTSTDVSSLAAPVKNIVCNSTATITLTLQSPTGVAGREYHILSKNTGNVISGTNNVLTRSGSVATTGILISGTAGSWARLVSDGTYYQVMAGS